MMGQNDLELQNKNYNTALYLAAVAGNVETVKIMVKENRRLLTIPGANRQMMPLYAAALFGNKYVVEYIYEESRILRDEDGWNLQNRGWLLEKCVENNMFDTALKIIKKYPELDSGSVLRVLAGKRETFHETKSNIMVAIKSVICLKRAPKEESNALTLLRFIWDDIVKKPTKEIDAILRGPSDSTSNKQDNRMVSGWAVKAMQFQKVIYEHVEKMNVESNNIIRGPPDALKDLRLQDLISESLVNMHGETQKIIRDFSNLIMQDNKPVSNKEHLALELQKLIFKHIADMHDKTVKIIKSHRTGEDRALQLKRGISEHIEKMNRETQEKITKPPPAAATAQEETGRLKPNLPRRYLFAAGSRENYLKIGVPLYEASIKCNWNAAKAILEKKQDLVRYSITENGETALHVAASAKGDPKDVVEFVKNLVGMMKEEDLALENESFNTALYLAAAAGNVETVKIMVEKNRTLPTIPGARQTMMPLYAAALFGNYDVVKYLYKRSKDLCDDGWNPQNRGWLLEKCVENDMFDVALKIVKKYPELGSALRVLARKPEAFHDTKSNIIGTAIRSVSGFIGLKVGAPEKESPALTLLRFI
ncbi:hypothetical protein L1987_34082 [Smallanthus sonchifolius]|uniref:Uncharacterized protein n=1 Tax=Smallanthus sonchifolius TaxID=185202 RepID=A0ACB9HS54_9ASTR|nr:hypothetical protein L1987_34082 [Smallanthus sonchifolius]